MPSLTTSTQLASRRSAFTLIELIVVLAILLLLLSGALIGIRASQITRRDNQRLADVLLVAQAIDKYSAENRGNLFTAGSNACIAVVAGSTLNKYFANNQLPATVIPAARGSGCIQYTQNTAGTTVVNLADTTQSRYTLSVELERPISDESAATFKLVPGASSYHYYYPGTYCGSSCP